MKIAHVIHNDGSGGGPQTVINHMKYYSKVHEIFLFHGGHGSLVAFCKKMGLSHRRIPMERLGLSFLGALVLYGYLRQHRPDVIIGHGQWGGFWASLAGWVAGVRRRVYITQWPSFYTDWDLWRIIRNFVVEFVTCALCDKVITLSLGNRREYVQRFPQWVQKMRLIPNATDLLRFEGLPNREQVRKELGWDADMIHVVCAGRLSTQKRVDWLLRAWKKVEEVHDSVALWILGAGEEEKALHALAKELELRRARFLGAKAGALRFMVAADIVAMPTMYEGHANVPLEAMGCGRPIVACAVDGVRESFTDGREGLLVRPGDVEGLARAILKLAESKALREEMGRAGRKRVQDFDLGKIMPRYLEVIEGRDQ